MRILHTFIVVFLLLSGCAEVEYHSEYQRNIPHRSDDTQDPKCFNTYGAMPGYCDMVFKKSLQ
jgi:uncharacterized protein YceK